MRPFRFIQVGCGARAEMWDQVVFRNQDKLETVAYVNRTLTKAQRFSQYHPERDIPYFSDLEAALKAVAADAALLLTPPDVHREQIALLARYGLPILAEKPLCDTLEETMDTMRMVDRAGTPLSLSLQFRYLPVSQELRRLCLSGELGKPGFGFFGYFRNRNGMRPDLNKYPLAMEHPMLLEQTIHHYDLIRYCYDSDPLWIDAHSWNPEWSMYAHDSNVMSMMEMKNGMRVAYMGTWTGGYNGPKEIMFQWRTDFSNGVTIQKEVFSDLWRANMDDPALSPCGLPAFTAFMDDTEILMLAFADAVRTGKAVPCDGWDHVKSMAMVFASIESTVGQKRVYMEDFYKRHNIALPR